MRSDYVNALERSVHDSFPNLVDPHVLKGILPAILFALVARDTNVIINTRSIVDISKSASKVLSTVFGLRAKRVRIRSLQSPEDLLTTLLVSTPNPSSSASSHKARHSHPNVLRSHSIPRPNSNHFTEGSDSTVPPPLPSFKHIRHRTDPVPHESDSQNTLHVSQVVIISGLEQAGRIAQIALAEALRTRQIVLETGGDGGSLWKLPDGFFIIFVSDVGDGRERPTIHTALKLDHFAFSVTLANALQPVMSTSPSPRLRSIPLPPPSPHKPPLLPFDQVPRPDVSPLPPTVSHYIMALLTATRHHPELDGTIITARCVRYAEMLVRASGLVFREGDNEERAMITEAHVRRTIPAVVAHRIRVRDGPREEIMGLLWKGAGVRRWNEQTEEMEENRRTVKEIIAEIIAQV